MNATATKAPSIESPQATYRSPQRCLLVSFRKSRQRWKAKAQERNRALKVLKVRVSDLECSRQNHAEQARQARTALAQAEQKIAELQAELAQTRAETAEMAAALEKKVARRRWASAEGRTL